MKNIDFVTWHYILKSNLKSLPLNIKSEIIKDFTNGFYIKQILEKIDNIQNDLFIFTFFCDLFHCNKNCDIKMTCDERGRISVDDFSVELKIKHQSYHLI